MAGDTTYQALERLSYMPDRDQSANGLVIAGQLYYDVYFRGGTINGVAIGGELPAAGIFTTLVANGSINLVSNAVAGGTGISLLGANTGADINIQTIAGATLKISSNDGGNLDGITIGANNAQDGFFAGLSAGGEAGISGSFAAGGMTVTVTNGIITGIA